jgi:ADP-heptose:LPS heptosyltransferase
MTKILVIRFSSIGDIVLTSPIFRCLKSQLENAEVHALTKKQYASLYASNTNIDQVHEWGEDNANVLAQLKQENFDYVIDLHRNIRTQKIKAALKKKSYSFPKLNVQKWLYVNFKYNKMPDVHIVDRYFEAVKGLGVKKDNKGLDFFTDGKSTIDKKYLTKGADYVCFAIGAQFATKKMPVDQLAEICSSIDLPIVIIGGAEDAKAGEDLLQLLSKKTVYNTCGKYSILESASIVKQAEVLVTHDTGMMHIAAAYKTPIVSIWGNTVPEFGMYPYRPQQKETYSIHEVKGLSCRPCSKIGYQQCPKKHFRCMREQDIDEISDAIQCFLG